MKNRFKLTILLILFVFFNLTVGQAKNFPGHNKDFNEVFENLRGDGFDKLKKVISTNLIDTPPSTEILEGFSCGNHRWFGHWGFEAAIPFEKNGPLKECLSNLPEKKREYVKDKIKKEWIRRIKNIEKEAVRLTGLPSKQAKALCGILYNTHLLGDWTPGNKELKFLADIKSIEKDLEKNLEILFGKNSRLVRNIKRDFKYLNPTSSQKHAEFILQTLKDYNIGEIFSHNYERYLKYGFVVPLYQQHSMSKITKTQKISDNLTPVKTQGKSETPKRFVGSKNSSLPLKSYEKTSKSVFYEKQKIIKSSGKIVGKIAKPIQVAIVVYESGEVVKHYIDNGELDMNQLIISASGAAGGTAGSFLGGFIGGAVSLLWKAKNPAKLALTVGSAIIGGIVGEHAGKKISKLILVDEEGGEQVIEEFDEKNPDVVIEELTIEHTGMEPNENNPQEYYYDESLDDGYDIGSMIEETEYLESAGSISSERPLEKKFTNKEQESIELTRVEKIFCLAFIIVLLFIFLFLRWRIYCSDLIGDIDGCILSFADFNKKIEKLNKDNQLQFEEKQNWEKTKSKIKKCFLKKNWDDKIKENNSSILSYEWKKDSIKRKLSEYSLKSKGNWFFKYSTGNFSFPKNEQEILAYSSKNYKSFSCDYASVYKRFFAFIIDVCIVYLFFLILDSKFDFSQIPDEGVFYIFLIMLVFYSATFEKFCNGSTVGKYLMGIYVKSEDIRHSNIVFLFFRSTIKYLISFMTAGLLYVYFFFSCENQTLHDVASFTLVLNKKDAWYKNITERDINRSVET